MEPDGAPGSAVLEGNGDADMDGGDGYAGNGAVPAQAGKPARPFPISYTPRTAAKKFNQCYGKMEEFLRADKPYAEKDRVDVLRKLQQLKALIDAEISRLQQQENAGDGEPNAQEWTEA